MFFWEIVQNTMESFIPVAFLDLLTITPYDLIMTLGIGFAIGLVLSMTGVGGGVLIIPVLRTAFHMNPVLAVGTASICAALMKINAAFLHIKMNNIDWKNSLLLLSGAIPATYLTTSLIISLSGSAAFAESVENLVNYLIVFVIIFSLISMIYKDVKSQKTKDKQAATPRDNVTTNRSLPVVCGLFCGVFIGATGVGGGVLLLPVLTVLLNVNVKQAIGSSIVIALLLSGISAISYSGGGQADISTAVLLVAGSLISVPIAGKIIHLISDKALHRTTLVLISVSALLMLSTSVV